MIEGRDLTYSIRLAGKAINCNCNGPLHTSRPWSQSQPTHADAFTKRTLESLISR